MATPLTPDQTADALLRRLRRTPELSCPDADAAAGPHLRVRWSGAVEIRCGAHSPHQAGFGPSAGAGDHRPQELSRRHLERPPAPAGVDRRPLRPVRSAALAAPEQDRYGGAYGQAGGGRSPLAD